MSVGNFLTMFTGRCAGELLWLRWVENSYLYRFSNVLAYCGTWSGGHSVYGLLERLVGGLLLLLLYTLLHRARLAWLVWFSAVLLHKGYIITGHHSLGEEIHHNRPVLIQKNHTCVHKHIPTSIKNAIGRFERFKSSARPSRRPATISAYMVVQYACSDTI